MPEFTIPDSFGSPLEEFNQCHTPEGSPKGGQFCSTPGAETLVGITSALPGRANRQVFQEMAQFKKDLAAIPTVSRVSVVPGIGAFEGGSEPTWVVSYRGNGEATKLLAKTGARYQQQAVLVFRGAGRSDGSPMVDFTFDNGVKMETRKQIHSMLIAAGWGGWSWFKRGGKTVLRAACVPQWGGKPLAHMAIAKWVSEDLTKMGLTHKTAARQVKVELMTLEGTNSYAKALAA